MLRYQMGLGGRFPTETPTPRPDRRHGTVCLLAAEALGKDSRLALPAAVGIEMANGFSEVHEELRLGVPSKQGRPTLWWVWGHSQGINAGDGMYALARVAVMEMAGNGVADSTVVAATRELDLACLKLCQARYREIDWEQRGELTARRRLSGIEGQDGALMGAAASLGGLGSGASAGPVEALGHYGLRAGSAWRVSLDIDELWGHAATGAGVIDVLDRRRSVPLLYALENASESARRVIDAVISREAPLGDEETGRLLGVMEDSGARAFAADVVDSYREEAFDALRRTALPSEALSELVAVTAYLTSQDS